MKNEILEAFKDMNATERRLMMLSVEVIDVEPLNDTEDEE